MISSKCYKLEIKAHILVEDGEIIQEIVTAPIIIYRGTEFNYETISKLEELAIQKILSRRPGEGK
jgi:hypothetical protein